MKKRKLVFCLLFIFLTLPAFAQITFQRGFGTMETEQEGVTAIETSDGGYLLTGLTRDANDNADVLLVKYDEFGKVVWSKTYGSPEYDKGYGLGELKGGGYIISAKTNIVDPAGDWWIIRTDENGDSLWTKKIGDMGTDIPYKVIPTDDGNFVVAGQVYGMYSCTIKNHDGYIIKLNPNGNEIWHHVVQNSIKDVVTDAHQTQDGGFVLCGHAWDSDEGQYNMFAYKVDNVGEKKWTKTYKLEKDNRAYGITELENGELILVGKEYAWKSCSDGDYDIHVKRIDNVGHVLQEKRTYTCGDEVAMDVLVLNDGNLILVGSLSSSAFVALFDTAGTRISHNSLGGHYTGRQHKAYTVSLTSDDGVIIGGYATLDKRISSTTVIKSKHALLAKTDLAGNYSEFYTTKDEMDYGNVEVGTTVSDTIWAMNNTLYDIKYSSHIDNPHPDEFSIIEGEISDTLLTNAADSLRIIVQYTPNEEVSDTTFLQFRWGNIEHSFNRERKFYCYGTGEINNTLPTISGLQDSVIFENDTTATLDIWNIVADNETADSLLTYTFTTSNDSVIADYDTSGGILTLSSSNSYTGTSQLTIEVNDGYEIVKDSLIVEVFDIPTGVTDNQIPMEFALRQNYPNPFNPVTTIEYTIPQNKFVSLQIYNIKGQLVKTLVSQKQEIGKHSIQFDGNNFASGIYIYKLQAGNFVDVKKLVLMK